MKMFYRQPAFWIKIAKLVCLISFILAFISLGQFCYLLVDKDNELTEQESKIDELIDSHHELIEKIDALIETLEQNRNIGDY